MARPDAVAAAVTDLIERGAMTPSQEVGSAEASAAVPLVGRAAVTWAAGQAFRKDSRS
jgi:hypothetical protein